MTEKMSFRVDLVHKTSSTVILFKLIQSKFLFGELKSLIRCFRYYITTTTSFKLIGRH